MQTFLPFEDFEQCTKCLDDKRLYKQIVECKQILNTLEKIKHREKNWKIDSRINIDNEFTYKDYAEYKKIHKIPWSNHPAVLMWKGYEAALILYQACMFKEWQLRRYPKLSWQVSRVQWSSPAILSLPPWLDDKELHLSHQANLYRKDPKHYRQFQPSFLKWNGDIRTVKCDTYKWPEVKND